jgi:hypothetical protein
MAHMHAHASVACSHSHTYATPATVENPFLALLGDRPAVAPENPFQALLAQPAARAPSAAVSADVALLQELLSKPQPVEPQAAPQRRTDPRRLICRCENGAACRVPGQDGWGLRPEY